VVGAGAILCVSIGAQVLMIGPVDVLWPVVGAIGLVSVAYGLRHTLENA
jgi:hypothetical protein